VRAACPRIVRLGRAAETPGRHGVTRRTGLRLRITAGVRTAPHRTTAIAAILHHGHIRRRAVRVAAAPTAIRAAAPTAAEAAGDFMAVEAVATAVAVDTINSGL